MSKNNPADFQMDELEILDLAIAVLGLDADFDDEDLIEQKIEDRFDIDFDTFGEIASALLPFVEVGKSPLTGTVYKGFANRDCWLAKREIKQ